MTRYYLCICLYKQGWKSVYIHYKCDDKLEKWKYKDKNVLKWKSESCTEVQILVCIKHTENPLRLKTWKLSYCGWDSAHCSLIFLFLAEKSRTQCGLYCTPDLLALITLQWSKWVKSHFFHIFLLMFDVNINGNSWTISVWFYILCFFQMIMGLNEQMYMCTKCTPYTIYIMLTHLVEVVHY